jgi:hypothetical protein
VRAYPQWVHEEEAMKEAQYLVQVNSERVKRSTELRRRPASLYGGAMMGCLQAAHTTRTDTREPGVKRTRETRLDDRRSLKKWRPVEPFGIVFGTQPAVHG